MHTPLCRVRALALVGALVVASPAVALSPRTFVASTGVNTGSCAVSAPCRTFQFALSQTIAGGEVVAIDSAGFGAVFINQSITLVAPPGVYAGVSVFSAGIGVNIAAGAADAIVLRGLVINSVGGNKGVRVSQAGVVHIERCLVTGFTAGIIPVGIEISPTAPVVVSISDSVVRDNSHGITVDASSAPASRVEISRTRVQHNSVVGLALTNVTRASIVDSLFGNNGAGIEVSVNASSPANSDVAIDRTAILDGDGIFAVGTFPPRGVVNVSNATIAGGLQGLTAGDGGFIRVMSSQIGGNGSGTSVQGSGVIQSLQNNMCYGNGSNCTFSGNIPLN
jgi:hypothetical protein